MTCPAPALPFGTVRILVAVLAALLCLAACGDHDDTPAAPPGGDTAFLATMHAHNVQGSDEALIKVAHAMCNAVESSHDVETFIGLALNDGVVTDDIGVIIIGATDAYCPEDREAVDAYTASH